MTSQDPTSGGRGEQDDADTAALLERFSATLRSAAVWDEPPADLGERIVVQVDALRTAGAEPADGDRATTPSAPVVLEEARRRRPGGAWLWPGLAVAAAAVVAFAAGALLTGDDDGRSFEPVADVELTPTELGGGARADGTVVDAGAGYSISIDVAGLPPAPEGAYYEGWLHDEETGDWVSVGTFHMRNGDDRVVLWSGVPISRYRELVVTSEVEGSSGDRGDVLLAGPFEGR